MNIGFIGPNSTTDIESEGSIRIGFNILNSTTDI